MSKLNGGIIGPDNVPTGTFGSASGIWSLSDVTNYKKQGTWPVPLSGHQVANSCRFNDGSSDSLTKTPSGAGNRRTWTYSTWLKRTTPNGFQSIMGADATSQGSGFSLFFSFDSTNVLVFGQGGDTWLKTNQLFRDPSAFYHIVLAVDTTNGTADNRVRMYINGSEVTSFGTRNNPSENYEMVWNNTVNHSIGADFPNSGVRNFFDGYMCETVNVDGQQLAPTSFGETDSVTNNWVPKDVSGLTFGTNGFYLDFKDSSALGNDVSGNNNDYTANNLTSIDQSVDTCTNNFITMNPNNATLGSVTLSEGNLKASLNGNYQVFGTINLTSGKWYWEQKLNDSSLFVSVADGNRATEDTGTGLLNRDYAWAYRSDGVKQHDGVTASYGNSFTTNDIIGVALDMDNGFIYFSKNGTFQNSGDPTSGSTGTGAAYSGLNTDAAAPNGLTPCLGQYGGDQITSWNFGSPPYAISSGNTDSSGMGNFEYAVPSGYYSICTRNLNLIG